MKHRIIASFIIVATVFGLIYGSAQATGCLQGSGGGTGICTATSTNVGQVPVVTSIFNGTPVYTLQNSSSSGGGGGSSTILYQGYAITLTPNPINTTGTVAVNTSTLTSYIATLGYLTVASGTAQFYPLSGNPSNFTTTTIQSVLNALSAAGIISYSSSTGTFTLTTSTLKSNTDAFGYVRGAGNGTAPSGQKTYLMSWSDSSTAQTANIYDFQNGTLQTANNTWANLADNNFIEIDDGSGNIALLPASGKLVNVTGQFHVTQTSTFAVNVGIGTNTPQRLLHVFGDQSAGVALFERSNTGTSSAAYGTAILKYDTTANMADGQGGGYIFELTDASGTNAQAGAYDFLSDGGGTSNTKTQIWTSNSGTAQLAATFDHLGRTTLNTTTVSDFTNTAVKNAIPVGDSGGHETAYTGSSCTNQGVSGISATGTVSCATFATSTNPGTVTTSTAVTANTLPIWTSGSALGNSHESEAGTSTFINASSTYLGTNTSTATSSLAWISNYNGAGYWDATGTVATISSCGTNPTGTVYQYGGRVTAGSTATTCTITFPIAFIKQPSAIVTEETGSVTNVLSYTISTSTLVVTQTGLGGVVFDYKIMGMGE